MSAPIDITIDIFTRTNDKMNDFLDKKLSRFCLYFVIIFKKKKRTKRKKKLILR